MGSQTTTVASAEYHRIERPLIGAADARGGDRGGGQSGQHEPFWATDPEHQAGDQCRGGANAGEPIEHLLGSPASAGSMHRARGTMANDRRKPEEGDAEPELEQPLEGGMVLVARGDRHTSDDDQDSAGEQLAEQHSECEAKGRQAARFHDGDRGGEAERAERGEERVRNEPYGLA